MPTGKRNNVAIHIPPNGVITSSFAYFSPLVLKKKKNMNNNMAMISGVPKPPYLIIDPSGAPIRNNTRQANDRVIFLCHSILCNRRSFCLILYSELAISVFSVIEPIIVAAFCSIANKLLSGIRSSILVAVFFCMSGYVYPISRYFEKVKIENTSCFTLAGYRFISF